MKVSVIIVSYNVKYFIDQCIASIKQSDCDFNFEIIVVDNLSTDGSQEFIRSKYPDIELIANQENVGFSKANNQGVAIAKGEYVLILNPDTLLSTNTLSSCVEFVETKEDVGIVGVRMYDGSGVYLPESKRGFPTPFVSFCKIFGLSHFFPKSRAFNQYYLGFLDADVNQEIDILTGAFMFLEKKVFLSVGGFDEDYFMYGEDIDLSYRVQQSGLKNYYVKDTSIIHYKGESTRKMSFDYVKRFYEAMIIFAKKHNSGAKVFAYTLAIKSAIYLKAILTFISRWVNRTLRPVRDAIILGSTFFLAKTGWEKYYFRVDSYFEVKSVQVNCFLFIVISLTVYLLLGKYHKSFNKWRWVKMLGTAILTLLVIYSLLPSDLRFSRAVILLGSALSGLLIYSMDLLMSTWRQGISSTGYRTAVVGQPKKSDQLLALLDKRSKSELIGFIHQGNESLVVDGFIGSISAVDSIIRFHNINEIIFDQQEINSSEIMQVMTTLDNACQFKIYTSNTESVVGSYSKEFQGQVDTFDIEYAISTSYNRFIKRAADVFLVLLAIAIFPLGWIINKCKLTYFTNALSVLFGYKTWVGYIASSEDDLALPKIRPAILIHMSSLDIEHMNQSQIRHLNFIYAREYNVWIDVRAFFNQISNWAT